MPRFHGKDRIKILAEEHYLKLIAYGSLFQRLPETCMLFKVKKMVYRIVYQTVLKVVTIQSLLHHLVYDFGVVPVSRQYHKGKACFLSNVCHLFIAVSVRSISTLKYDHTGHISPCQFFYCFLLSRYILSHSGK